ncbi:diguanylate cyclase, partial [Streptomyces brasiliscabiei]
GTTRPEARALCERIRTGFAAAVAELCDDPDLGATTSAGLACLISGSSPEAVLTAADTALYRAKHDGRNRVAVSA